MFCYDNSINLFDVISLVITSIIGIYIAYYLHIAQERTRVEKDIMLSELEKIETVMDELFKTFISSDSIDNFKLTSMIGSCRKRYSNFKNVDSSLYDTQDDSSRLDDITKGFIRLNKLTEREPDNDIDVKIANDIVTFSTQRKAEIINQIDSLCFMILNKKIETNKRIAVSHASSHK